MTTFRLYFTDTTDGSKRYVRFEEDGYQKFTRNKYKAALLNQAQVEEYFYNNPNTSCVAEFAKVI